MGKTIVLASGSPRRAKILAAHGVPFTVLKTEAPEVSLPHAPEETVRRNALAKLDAAYAALGPKQADGAYGILAADTIVWFANRIYGKPCDLDEAAEFLRTLSGQTHTVFTGLAFRGADGSVRTETVRSGVIFRTLDEATITNYLARVKPLDRAGAYDIDESGDLIVAGHTGSYENIMGLPWEPVARFLSETAAPTFPEYELAGIETIARGVCIRNGRILLCRAKGGATTYLPGGHIEFGETGRAALVRETKEELGLAAETGAFLGAVENSFTQHGKPHSEINLVYELILPPDAETVAKEDWIAFEWRDLAHLDDLLPAAFRKLAQRTGDVPFRP